VKARGGEEVLTSPGLVESAIYHWPPFTPRLGGDAPWGKRLFPLAPAYLNLEAVWVGNAYGETATVSPSSITLLGTSERARLLEVVFALRSETSAHEALTRIRWRRSRNVDERVATVAGEQGLIGGAGCFLEAEVLCEALERIQVRVLVDHEAESLQAYHGRFVG